MVVYRDARLAGRWRIELFSFSFLFPFIIRNGMFSMFSFFFRVPDGKRSHDCVAAVDSVYVRFM